MKAALFPDLQWTDWMDTPFEERILCSDGEAGRLAGAVQNPINDRFTDIVVRTAGNPILSRLVPIGRILSGDAEIVRLDCRRSDVDRMELFSEFQFIPADYSAGMYLLPYTVPADGWGGPPDGPTADPHVLRRDSLVEARDGFIGIVDEFIVEPAQFRITHLLLRRGHLWEGREVAIPVRAVSRLDRAAIRLKLTVAEVGALPALRVIRRWN